MKKYSYQFFFFLGKPIFLSVEIMGLLPYNVYVLYLFTDTNEWIIRQSILMNESQINKIKVIEFIINSAI